MLWRLLIILIPLALVGTTVGQYPLTFNLTWEDNVRYRLSSDIFKLMNISVDPCDDYYQFVCGNWRNYYPAGGLEKATNQLNLSVEKFQRKLFKLLLAENSNDLASERKLKDFYKSCLKPVTQSEYRNEMKSLLREFGKMPMLEGKKWQSKKFNWLETVGKIYKKYNINILFDLSHTAADDIVSNILIMTPPELRLYDLSDANLRQYQSEIENNLIEFLGSKKSLAKQTAKDLVKFEVGMLKAAQKSKINEVTVEINEMKLNYPNLQKLLKISYGYLPNGSITIYGPDYFDTFENIIKKTSKSIVANYVFYKLMLNFAEDYIQEHTESFCASQTNSFFPEIFGKMIYRAKPMQATEQEFYNLWQEILISMVNVLDSNILSWYDDRNREFILEKFYGLKFMLNTFDDYDFDAEYKSLDVKPHNYMYNIKQLKSFNGKTLRSNLDMAPDNFRNVGHLRTPVYMSSENAINIPIIVMVETFFNIQFVPQVIKFARTGAIMGHELMHAFSGQFRNYDKFGYDFYRPSDDIERNYEERKNCIYEQFANNELFKGNRQQDDMQTENIADIGGIYLAYQAYMRWLEDETRTRDEIYMEFLPGLNFNNKQLFFIYYSQSYCNDYVEEFDTESSTDQHSLDTQRAVIPLMNNQEFAKAFNCPIGSRMNPSKKCSLL